MKSLFLDQFRRLKAEGADLVKLYGDIMLVEGYAPEETKTESGIILAGSDRQRVGFNADLPAFYTVLYVGEGFYDDETGESVPVEVQPGDIILTGKQSVVEISKFGPIISSKEHRLCLSREQDIQLHFKGPGAYDRVMNLLKSKGTDVT